MMRKLFIVVMTLLLVGCHAPKPNLSMFGASKVPPHPTGSYKTQDESQGDDYYNPASSGAPSSAAGIDSGASTRRGDDGRLLAIDATDSRGSAISPRVDGSREIMISRDRRSGFRVDETGPGVREADRRNDDGFRAVPVRITRSGLQRASFSDDEDASFSTSYSEDSLDANFSDGRVPSAAEILVPDRTTRESGRLSPAGSTSLLPASNTAEWEGVWTQRSRP